MADQTFYTEKEFPYFLQDYGKLLSHFESGFESLASKEKGDQFATFTERLVPHSEIGRRFKHPQKSPKATYDEGVDLSCESKDETEVLYIQAKYSIPSVDEIDLILSKFESYESKRQTVLQPKLLPEPDEGQLPTSHFVIVTARDLHSRILPRYKKSQRRSVQFYNSLESEGRIHIIDGPEILQILRKTYRKSYLLPSRFRLSSAKPFVHMNNVYIGVVAGSEIARLYEEFGNALFLENIREYLGPTSGKMQAEPGWMTVNQAIAHTLVSHPDQFLARNNGIAFRASSITLEGEMTLILEDASIVNGCQTTMAVVQNPRENCHVLVKAVEISDAWDIAEAANFQNEIDQITLTLARYIRPQMIRAAASKFGVRFESTEGASAFAVLDSIYREEITEREFRALFLGFFSNSPRNILAVNYTKVNTDVINRLFNSDNPDRETTYELLFRIHQMTQEGAGKVEDSLRGDEGLLDLFQRFWKENKPNYRAFLAILAACGCAKMDIYSKAGRPTYEDVMGLLTNVQATIDRSPDVFLRYYHLAFTSVALDAIRGNQSREETLQQMKAIIEGSSFGNLYLKLRALASTDYWLDQREGSD